MKMLRSIVIERPSMFPISGHRWEQGVIKEKYSKMKFVVTYDFLLAATNNDDSVDPDVIENLLGKKSVNWRYK